VGFLTWVSIPAACAAFRIGAINKEDYVTHYPLPALSTIQLTVSTRDFSSGVTRTMICLSCTLKPGNALIGMSTQFTARLTVTIQFWALQVFKLGYSNHGLIVKLLKNLGANLLIF